MHDIFTVLTAGESLKFHYKYITFKVQKLQYISVKLPLFSKIDNNGCGAKYLNLEAYTLNYDSFTILTIQLYLLQHHGYDRIILEIR